MVYGVKSKKMIMYPFFLGVQCDFFVCFSKYTPKNLMNGKLF